MAKIERKGAAFQEAGQRGQLALDLVEAGDGLITGERVTRRLPEGDYLSDVVFRCGTDCLALFN